MKTLKQAARIITRMKAYSIICVLGLVISLAGTLTLVRYIHQEFTVDSFLTDLDRLCLLSAGDPQDASVKELMSNVNVNEGPFQGSSQSSRHRIAFLGLFNA